MKYRVWLSGSSMSVNCDGHVDVYANSYGDAERKAKEKLTKSYRTSCNWDPSMLKIKRMKKQE